MTVDDFDYDYMGGPSNKKNGCIASLIKYAAYLFIIALILFILAHACHPISKTMHMREITATVTDKTYTSKDGYLIFTKDENNETNVYEISDAIFKFRFDSSDDYAGIEVGSKYTFKIGGKRNKLLSHYPNIYEYELVE